MQREGRMRFLRQHDGHLGRDPFHPHRPRSLCLQRCSNLAAVLILSSQTVIKTGSFVDCIHLASVMIPGSVMGIGASAFLACSGLLGVRIPSLVTTLGATASIHVPSASVEVYKATPPWDTYILIIVSQ